jgi:hypothetical protein
MARSAALGTIIQIYDADEKNFIRAMRPRLAPLFQEGQSSTTQSVNKTDGAPQPTRAK